MLFRSKSDDMGMNAERPAIVLEATHPHGPALGKWITPALLLKPQLIQKRSGTRQETVRIQDRQVNNPFPTASRH